MDSVDYPIMECFEFEWWNEIGEYVKKSKSFDCLLYRIAEVLYNKQEVLYPHSKDILKVFEYPLNEVKVVVVSQDPYYNGNADGLAFSCLKEISPSLKQILFAMFVDIKGLDWVKSNQLKAKDYMNLEYLAKQGVMLFNPIMTVIKDKPLSCENWGWKDFSEEVFRILAKRDNIVYLLWGAKAQEWKSKITNTSSLILQAEHPASAAYNNKLWTCNHFSKANEFLKSKNLKEIQWIKQ